MKMKKKTLKRIALITALVLIAAILFASNALNGNPVSRKLATDAAYDHLAENYSQMNCYLDDVIYDFKLGCYVAYIDSNNNIDIKFDLLIDMFGNVMYDGYEAVTSGRVTAYRLEGEYRELAEQIFRQRPLTYNSYVQYATLEFHSRELAEEDVPDYSLVMEDLIVNHFYDIRELGAQAGHLVIHAEHWAVTYDRAAQFLLEIRALYDNANAPFRAIDFVMEKTADVDNNAPLESICIENFPYEAITEEGLAERIEAAHAELMAREAAQDDK